MKGYYVMAIDIHNGRDVFIALALFAALVAAGCNQSSDTSKEKATLVNTTDRILVVLGEDTWGNEDAFDNDSVIQFGGDDTGGEVVVYVNDSPWFIHVWGGHLFQLAHLLEPGKNEIRFEGKHTARVFAKILLTNAFALEETGNVEIKNVYGKSWLQTDGEPVTITFELDESLQKSVYELLPDDLESRDQQREEIMAYIRELKDCYDKRDGERATRLSNLELVATPWGRWISEEDIQEINTNVANVINNGQFEWITPLEDMKMIFGKRAVLVYAGAEHDDVGAYFFRGRDRETKETSLTAGPLVVARVQGKWVVLK